MRYLSADVRAHDGWNANFIWCRGTDAGGHGANHPRPHGEHIPTPESPVAADPVREASLSPHRQQQSGRVGRNQRYRKLSGSVTDHRYGLSDGTHVLLSRSVRNDRGAGTDVALGLISAEMRLVAEPIRQSASAIRRARRQQDLVRPRE